MRRPIAVSLAPNLEKKDVFCSIKLLFSPWKYFNGKEIKLLEQWFCQYFKVSYAVSFNSGRSSLFAILKSLSIGKEDEVILQAFTCVAVANAILLTGAKPVYADINHSLTIDIKDLTGKITPYTKAIIVQHTFGIPASMDLVKKIARKNKLFIIEDCAHVIGGVYKNKKLGSFGEASFFSFGRDKAFSSTSGGMVITNNKSLGIKLRNLQKNIKYPSFFWVIQQLFHPIAFSVILPLYDFFSVGKIILVFLQKINLLSFPVSTKEKEGTISIDHIRRLPNALSSLALVQLKRVRQFNKKREGIASIYLKELKKNQLKFLYENTIPFLRFPLLVEKRDQIIKLFRKNGIYLGTWYSGIIDPEGVNLEKIFYEKGSCQNAEYIAQKIINLPTYPLMKVHDTKKILFLLNSITKTNV